MDGSEGGYAYKQPSDHITNPPDRGSYSPDAL
jgi:hypothetical protein